MPPEFLFRFNAFIFLLLYANGITFDASQTPCGLAKIGSWRNLRQQKQQITQLIESLVNITFVDGPPKCMVFQCKVFCYRTHMEELGKNIKNALLNNNNKCPLFEKLCLYNNEFPQQKIAYGFLGDYSRRIRSLHIVASNVSTIGEGAFGNSIFKEIYLEALQLNELRKDIFRNISKTLATFSIIQHRKRVKNIEEDFLSFIKTQLKRLTLKVGLPEISNATAANSLLTNLVYVDLSYNNFTNTLTDETFGKLWIVEYLDLSHCDIAALPIYIFSKLVDSLVYVNLSHNKLIKINHLIFGYHAIAGSILVDAQDNPWNCSCLFQKEIKQILQQSETDYTLCRTPAQYEGLSIWDERICSSDLSWYTSVTTKTITKYTELLTTVPTTAPAETFKSSAAASMKTISLQCTCVDHDKVKWKKVLLSEASLHLRALSGLRVEVIAEFENLQQSYVVLWFNQVVSDLYGMATNYNQYGLGCYGPITYSTIISDLKPSTAYTFCLISHQQRTVTPFHCESVRVGSNLGINYSGDAYSSGDRRSTDIALIVIGALVCFFLGIIAIYMLFKYKPTLFKSRKRVRSNGYSIALDPVIQPRGKSLDDVEDKGYVSYGININNNISAKNRRSSVDSKESNQSYINVNLYEVIPAYLRLQGDSSECVKNAEEFESTESNMSMPPLASEFKHYDASEVRYAEVSPRSKRGSNDPLPALPTTKLKLHLR